MSRRKRLEKIIEEKTGRKIKPDENLIGYIKLLLEINEQSQTSFKSRNVDKDNI